MRLFLRRTPLALVLCSAVVLILIQSRGPRTRPETQGEADLTAESPSLRAAVSEPVAQADRDLVSYVKRPDYADRLEAGLSVPAADLCYARLNPALVGGKRSPLWGTSAEARRIALTLPSGARVEARFLQAEMLDSERFLCEGVVAEQPGSSVILSGHSAGQYTLTLLETRPRDAQGNPLDGPRSTVFQATGASEVMAYTVDQSKAGSCGGIVVPRLDEKTLKVIAARKAAAQSQADSLPTASPAPSADILDEVTVDVLFAYTNAVTNSLFGTLPERHAAILTSVDNVVAQANNAYFRSQISLRIRSVGAQETVFDETSMEVGSLNSDALEAIQDTSDGKMDEIEGYRDSLGADLVCLMVSRHDSSRIGLGFMLSTPKVSIEEASRTNVSQARLNDLFAFCVVTYGYIQQTELVPHELGHNMGCQHDRDNAKDDVGQLNPGAFPYSYGYRFIGKNSLMYRTIMAYAPGTRLAYFSNPKVIASEAGVDMPVGVAEGSAGEAENALTIRRTAFELAQFRQQKQTPYQNGTLVNVSTRGWVGQGDNQMIAGFVINGSTGKEVLVRAAGPSLLDYGVTGVLTDPKISIYRLPGQVIVHQNDDLDKESNYANILATAQSIGAFPFTSTKETALLVTLPNGSYTANVEGVGGLTGNSLVEVYETGTVAGTRVVNLSTRAYVDKGKELIAGFVIQGLPGETKRVLVCCRGPDLASFGITNALTDPIFEVYRQGEGGGLIYVNDDWTASSTRVNGVADDSMPVIRYYDEKAISATGYAPGNRRDPALLADLEPGAYTVIVKPFERLSSVPSENQPAEPGVALVEVYEIAP